MVFFRKKKKDDKPTRVVRGQGNKLIATNPNRRKSSGKTTTAATEKAAWLKKTRNSPAAKAGISDDMRWNAYQKNKKRLKV